MFTSSTIKLNKLPKGIINKCGIRFLVKLKGGPYNACKCEVPPTGTSYLNIKGVVGRYDETGEWILKDKISTKHKRSK